MTLTLVSAPRALFIWCRGGSGQLGNSANSATSDKAQGGRELRLALVPLSHPWNNQTWTEKSDLHIGFFPYRYFRICTIIFGILFLVIIIHLSLRKCLRKPTAQPKNDEISHTDLEVEQVEQVEHVEHVEQVEHIVDAPFLLLMTLTNLSIHISFFLPIQILPYRFSLALQDFSTILPNPLLMSYFYYRNPNLWNFVMKKIFRGSSVQPVPQNEIQLQNI